MTGDAVKIRVARPGDAPALLEVYRPYVERTAISFELEAPGPEEFQRRVERTLERYPYLVAERRGELLGYTYAGPFVGRAAYGWSAEVTIYLREDSRGLGLGRRLYQALEGAARAQHLQNLYACVGLPQGEDPYLTPNSFQFHRHLGYRLVGEFRQCGYKFGRWYHMVWMEKMLGNHSAPPAPVTPFPQLEGPALEALGIYR